MDGKVYVINAFGDTLKLPTPEEKAVIGERIMCFDAKTGKVLWERVFNVFHSDIVTNRLGWNPLAADAKNKRIFAHTTAGFLLSLDAETGKTIWERQMTEEFGRFTGYGGRIGGGPIFDSGLVIIGMNNSAWGDFGPGAFRMQAYDAATGKLMWWGATPPPPKETYYSHPVVHVINGERLLITGGGDGGLHAFHVRTGKKIWTYYVSAKAVYPSPVVAGNLVYICQGEENLDGGDLGRVVCVDASKIVDGKPTLVWEKKGIRFGLSSPAVHDGKLYIPDDGAKLHCFNGKTGKLLWKINCGTVARGAPVIADGKIFITATDYRFHIIKLPADGSQPDMDTDAHSTFFKNKEGADGFVEVNSTPSIADGCVYVATRDDLYCIGKDDRKAFSDKPKGEAAENPGDASKGYAGIFPVEVGVHPGESAEFEVKWFTSTGVPAELPKDAKIEFTLPEGPIPKGGKTAPPALKAEMSPSGSKCKVTVDPKVPAQGGYLEAKIGTTSVKARVRVIPTIPYSQDFEKLPEGAVPGGWVNTLGKYRVLQVMEDGTPNKVFFKVNNDARPPFARANAYITAPNATDYTIEADVKGVEVRGKFPDMGIIANRYVLYLDGKNNDQGSRELKLLTWEALTPRPEGRVQSFKAINWKSGAWYHLKLTVEIGEKSGTVKGKVWEKGQPEPAEWSVQLTDPRPNREGAAGLYGYVTNAQPDSPGSEIYYDNVKINPNKK
jgi:outer membrane protein assembly factor BamB